MYISICVYLCVRVHTFIYVSIYVYNSSLSIIHLYRLHISLNTCITRLGILFATPCRLFAPPQGAGQIPRGCLTYLWWRVRMR